jgi:hypothetical protein
MEYKCFGYNVGPGYLYAWRHSTLKVIVGSMLYHLMCLQEQISGRNR